MKQKKRPVNSDRPLSVAQINLSLRKISHSFLTKTGIIFTVLTNHSKRPQNVVLGLGFDIYVERGYGLVQQPSLLAART